jgi:signal peptidase II
LSARLIGFSLAFFAFVSDQASKLWMLYGFDIQSHMASHGPLQLTPFFDVILVWNRGISYGLFQQNSDFGRYVLVGIAVLCSIALVIWILRNTHKSVALGLGLVLGGALANGLDRLMHGAVVDLFHFYWGTFSWYVFNLADVWIVAGAAILIYDSFLGTGRNDAAKP